MATDEHPAEFELTVVGGLGAVLRWALRPALVVRSGVCTSCTVVTTADVDAVVAQLDAAGLEIDDVYLPDTERRSQGNFAPRFE